MSAKTIELPPLADSLQRLRDSIEWLRDGKPHKHGIGVADMIVLEAALASRSRAASEPGEVAATSKCSPTLTECPRCKNVISKCDGIFASSPVAAEGQKAASEMYLGLCLDDDDTLHATIMRKEADGGATVLLSDYVKMPRGQDIIMRASDTATATPTASMADAAKAVQHDESDPLQQLTDLSQELGLYEFPNKPLAATPGPRGENAGGVVDQERLAINPTHEAADAFWSYWRENGETHKHGYYESTWGAINCALRAAGIREHNYGNRATAWGLRIAEKGDDRG